MMDSECLSKNELATKELTPKVHLYRCYHYAGSRFSVASSKIWH